MIESNRLYCFRRNQPNGLTTLLAGAELWAPDADEAMRRVANNWGTSYTAKQGCTLKTSRIMRRTANGAGDEPPGFADVAP